MSMSLLLDTSKPLIWTIDGVLSAEECAATIARMEEVGYESATVNTEDGPQVLSDTRNNSRATIHDPALAADLFERVRDKIPARIFDWEAVGLNERFRGYRYHPGQYFAPHFDGSFTRNHLERSYVTFMVYLNEGFGGGETGFPRQDRKILPRAGQALCFQHYQLHEGCPLTSGVKYVLRSDVMYRRAPRQ